MPVNWITQANKVRRALKKDFPDPLTVNIITTGTYNISTGKNTTTKVPYTTHGAVKSFEIEKFSVVNPEEVEIVFHSGDPVDSIPDLTDQKNIEIVAFGKIYKVNSIRAVRPAGVTLMYKAIAVESEDESE
jgi:hypothetical protein